MYNKPAEDSELVVCNNPGKKIYDTGQPGLQARRHSCKAFHRYGVVHIGLPHQRSETVTTHPPPATKTGNLGAILIRHIIPYNVSQQDLVNRTEKIGQVSLLSQAIILTDPSRQSVF